MKLYRHILLGLVLVLGPWAVAQEHGSPQQTPAPQHAAEPAQHQPAGEQLSESPDHATLPETHSAGQGEVHEGDHHAEFKYSPSVQFIAKHTGLSVTAAYWLLLVINFLIIGLAILWALKKNLPGMFRARTEAIRKGMDEARRASEDANRRLSEIEGRLGRLDAEIAEMRQKAEADAATEEQRIRQSAEEDGRKIVDAAEQEIDAATKSARRELKAYAAELAVSLAEKQINIDPQSDEALVSTFVRELGKDGRR